MKLFLLLLLATTLCAQAHTLRYKASKGQTMRYLYVTNYSSTQTMNGSEQTFETGITMTLGVKADDVWKDSLAFVATAEKVKIDLSEMMKAALDSKNDPATLLEGKRTRYTVSSIGKQLSEKNLDSIKGFSPMVRGIATSIPFSLPMLPEKPIAVGGTWTVPGDTAKMRGMKMTKVPSVVSTFDKIVDTLGYNCARILTVTKGPIAGSGEMQQGITMAMNGDVNASGVYYFALNEGMLVAMQQRNENDATISVTGQMSMVMPMHQEITTTMVKVK